MEMDGLQIGLEILLSLLLAVSIIYSMHLGRSLALLRRDRDALNDLILSLQDSSRQAESGIEKLHRSGESVGRNLGKLTDQARILRAELTTVTEKAEAVSERLDAAVRAGRQIVEPATAELQQKPDYEWQVAPQKARQRTLAELDLIRALRGKQGL